MNTQRNASTTPLEEAAGGPEAWVDAHGDYLYSFALSLRIDPALAEDLVQETFLTAIKKIDSFAGKSTLRTWLSTILRNKFIDYRRKTKKEAALPEDEPSTLGNFNDFGIWNQYVPNWAGNPDEALQNQELHQTFLDCVAKLPPRLERVFTCKYGEDLDTEEACKLLDISTSYYWTMMHRARMSLRDCLEENWYRASK